MTVTFTFDYLLKAHVKVYLGYDIVNGTYASELVDGVGFNWTGANQIQTTASVTLGTVLTVARRTPSNTRLVDWQDGGQLTADDLDTADLQNLYVVQEQQDKSDAVAAQQATTTATANNALTASAAATTTANTANTTANGLAASIATANTNASNAVTTANAANTTANGLAASIATANTNASAAVTTANAASTTANTANTTANGLAASIATANTNASNAVTTADAASTTANGLAASIATANTNASNAVTTADAASTTANAALPKAGGTMTGNITFNGAQTFNKVAITAPATSATLTIADGKTLTASNTLTFTGTDASSVAFGTGGTVVYAGGKLNQFASTTSSELAGVISDETGTGALVFANTPTLVTPVIGAASATSINKVAITAPATSATLTVADGKTLTALNTLTLTGTDSSSVAFGAGGTVAYDGPTFRATAPGNQTVTSLSTTKITLTTEIWDTNSAYDAANSRFQPATAGYYLAICNVLYTAAGSPFARIYKNGTFYAGSPGSGLPITTTVFLNGSNDYLEVYNLQSSAQSNTISSDTFFTVSLLRKS